MSVHYYCDCLNVKDPGPAAIGVYITEHEQPIGTIAYRIGHATYHDAALRAILAAATSMMQWGPNTPIHVCSTSQLSIRQIMSVIACDNSFRDALLDLITRMTAFRSITWYHKPTDATPGLRKAGYLARLALDRAIHVRNET